MENIIEQKKMILDHVLYEMEMYLYSQVKFPRPRDGFEWNQRAECELTHLRNLLYFFCTSNKKETDIYYNDLVEDIDSLEIRENVREAKDIISRAVSHITKKRFEENITEKVEMVVDSMREKMISRIIIFVNSLNKNLIEEYKMQLNNPDIQNLIHMILKLYEIYQQEKMIISYDEESGEFTYVV